MIWWKLTIQICHWTNRYVLKGRLFFSSAFYSYMCFLFFKLFLFCANKSRLVVHIKLFLLKKEACTNGSTFQRVSVCLVPTGYAHQHFLPTASQFWPYVNNPKALPVWLENDCSKTKRFSNDYVFYINALLFSVLGAWAEVWLLWSHVVAGIVLAYLLFCTIYNNILCASTSFSLFDCFYFNVIE